MEEQLESINLSVILITKNEEKRIRSCLESIKFVDEIVVFDSGSEDRTVEICKEFGAQVYITDWPGFGPQKQRALAKAKGKWVLSIDADEVVTASLQTEILSATRGNGDIYGYWIPRLSYYCGKPVYHCGWYPDYIVRLFLRERGQFSSDLVHEKIIVSGSTSKLESPLLHYPYENLEQVISKINTYSTLGAEKIFATKKNKGGLAVALVRSFLAFFKIYILKGGFLDGRVGLVIAITSGQTAFYKYLKLSLMHNAFGK